MEMRVARSAPQRALLTRALGTMDGVRDPLAYALQVGTLCAIGGPLGLCSAIGLAASSKRRARSSGGASTA
eukprot:11223945-Lingulodinium_polyedra.AAC.1